MKLSLVTLLCVAVLAGGSRGQDVGLIQQKVEPNTLQFFFLDKWVPALITIFVGGVFASVFIPRLQTAYASRRALVDKRYELVGTLAFQFRKYIVSWRRLRQLAAGLRGAADDDAKERLLAAAAQRNDRKDELIETLCRMRVLFSEDLAREISDFLDWDEGQTSKELNELPPAAEWIGWEVRLTRKAGFEARR